MRKVLNFLTFLWGIFFVLFLVSAGYYFYDINKENNLVRNKAIQNTTQEEILYEKGNVDHPFVLDGDIKDSIVFYAASYYYSLPEIIRMEFSKDGWQVVLTDKDISKEYYHGPIEGRLAGLTDCSDKRIYIHNTREDIQRAMIHEFGHFFDYSIGMGSVSFEFKEIYEVEKELFKEKRKIDNHNISNEMEYFAETFSQFLLYPDILKKNCPQTYDYLMELINYVFAQNH